MATLSIYVEGGMSDLEFLKARITIYVEDALAELVETYAANLDDDVTLSGWELE